MVAAICVFTPSPGRAQDALAVGERVRVHVAGAVDWVEGRVDGLEADTLALSVSPVATRRVRCAPAFPACAAVAGASGREPVRIGMSDIDWVRRSVGTRRNPKQVALIGGLVGALGGALWAGTCMGCYSEWALGGAVVVGVPSAVFGAIIGSLVATDVWQEVPIHDSARDARLTWRPAISPARTGGVSLVWSIR
jgi:hypothetical protein